MESVLFALKTARHVNTPLTTALNANRDIIYSKANAKRYAQKGFTKIIVVMFAGNARSLASLAPPKQTALVAIYSL